jgi:hypothetical protein
VRKPEEDYLVDTEIDGRIISKWILKKYGGRMCTGFIWLKIQGSLPHSCKHDSETSNFSRKIMYHGFQTALHSLIWYVPYFHVLQIRFQISGLSQLF